MVTGVSAESGSQGRPVCDRARRRCSGPRGKRAVGPSHITDGMEWKMGKNYGSNGSSQPRQPPLKRVRESRGFDI
ncbi:hypothetical protein J4Q44_G00127820 [Coregonus suidteri]|uniref:Uncharacterized protein n=1 Tax=Coregonus suidteri TaxID=861788 RepID=A0AAN8M268_9TELE